MKYIQIVPIDMKEKVMQKSLSTVDILIKPLTVFQIGILFWVVVSHLQKDDNNRRINCKSITKQNK